MEKIKIIRSEVVHVLGTRALNRSRVPGGWICWSIRSGTEGGFFVPDPEGLWQPVELEKGADFRLSGGRTEWDVEVLAVELHEAALEKHGGNLEEGPPPEFEAALEKAERQLELDRGRYLRKRPGVFKRRSGA